MELLTKQSKQISEEVKRIAQRLMSQRRVSQSAAAAENDEDWLEDDGDDGDEPWATPQPQPEPEPRRSQPEAFVTPPTRAAVRTAVQATQDATPFVTPPGHLPGRSAREAKAAKEREKLAAKAKKQEEAKRKKEAARIKKQEQVRSLPLPAGGALARLSFAWCGPVALSSRHPTIRAMVHGIVLARPIWFDDSWAWLVQKEAKSRQKAQQQQELEAIVREMEADTRRKKEEQAAQKRGNAAQKQARKTPPEPEPEPEPAGDGFTVPEMSMEAKVKARQEERLHSDRMAAMRQEQKDRERKIVETEVENAVRLMCLLVYVARRAAGIAPPSQQSCSGE